ncbi:MAG: UDPGP type 1 family protein [Phycisphaerales bacterium]|nr:MAG: UDPGP type 1 family protein [Phycisphaerales bacterium]
MNIDDIRALLRGCDQTHLLRFWDDLSARQREELIGDLLRVDFEQVARLIPTHVQRVPDAAPKARIDPAPVITAKPGSQRHREGAARGAAMITSGTVAALVVAGGQGSRLGFDGPKGMYPISPVRNKTLFRLFAESILATQRRFAGTVPWYIMTSEMNDRASRDYFAANKYFGLDSDNVIFFKQGVMPAIGRDGKILLDDRHRVAMSPDGHGGTLRALACTGALRDMATRGIEAVSYFQVDNPLVTPVDPVFIGLHDLTGSEASSLAVPKADDLEKVGNFALVNGKICVVEYSDLPEHHARARNPDGSRWLDNASIAIHVFSRRFIERLTDDIHAVKLPWHRAVKKVAHVDLDSGRRIEPESPNAVKLEMFVFDALPLADKTMVLLAKRSEVFSPVKNATGVDSAETARRDMIRRAADWLQGCGVAIPARNDGEPDAVLEISPLYALDAAQLAERITDKPTVPPSGTLYLE